MKRPEFSNRSSLKIHKIMPLAKVTIPKPCHASWSDMIPDKNGRFCGSCQKIVIDFTSMNDDQLKNYFQQVTNNKICGRFNADQVEVKQKKYRLAPLRSNYVNNVSPWRIFLFSAMGVLMTLTGCKNVSQNTTGEVTADDSLKTPKNISTNAHISVDSLRPSMEGTYVTGKIAIPRGPEGTKK